MFYPSIFTGSPPPPPPIPDDICVRDYGTVWTFTGLTAAGRDFLTDDVSAEDWQRSGDMLTVDWRPARALLEHIEHDTGLTTDLA